VQSNRRYVTESWVSAASPRSGSPGTAVVVTGQSCQNHLLTAVATTRSLSTTQGRDESCAASEIGMITYAGKATVV
jgi:hypothetical protein